MTLSIQERINLYKSSFPKWPAPTFDGKRMSGVWLLGNNYKGSGYYGAYPPGYLKRIMSMFPDCRTILHAFSGSLKRSDLKKIHPLLKYVLTTDINPSLNPDVVADLHEADKVFEHNFYDLILADPPYSKEDAKKYGTPMVNRKKVLSALHKILKPGGTVVWLDHTLPMYKSSEFDLWGLICVVRSTNHRVRLASFFSKKGPEGKEQGLRNGTKSGAKKAKGRDHRGVH